MLSQPPKNVNVQFTTHSKLSVMRTDPQVLLRLPCIGTDRTLSVARDRRMRFPNRPCLGGPPALVPRSEGVRCRELRRILVLLTPVSSSRRMSGCVIAVGCATIVTSGNGSSGTLAQHYFQHQDLQLIPTEFAILLFELQHQRDLLVLEQ